MSIPTVPVQVEIIEEIPSEAEFRTSRLPLPCSRFQSVRKEPVAIAEIEIESWVEQGP
jgi:hypothetical protein